MRTTGIVNLFLPRLQGEMIREYFRNYCWDMCDPTLKLGYASGLRFYDRCEEEDWTVTLAYTGERSDTDHRIKVV